MSCEQATFQSLHIQSLPCARMCSRGYAFSSGLLRVVGLKKTTAVMCHVRKASDAI